MSDRLFISEEEIKYKYGKPIVTLREPWKYSNVYYDDENDCFIEECYHEEYLDCGTVRDGCYPISETRLWDKLVDVCNEEGMCVYLKIRKKAPNPEQSGESISMDEFCERIKSLKQSKPRRCFTYEQIGSVVIITNESDTVLEIVGKAENYYFIYTPKADVKLKGFHTLGEALAAALHKATIYYNYQVERDKVVQQKDSDKTLSTPVTPTNSRSCNCNQDSDKTLSTPMTSSKKSIFKKLWTKQ